MFLFYLFRACITGVCNLAVCALWGLHVLVMKLMVHVQQAEGRPVFCDTMQTFSHMHILKSSLLSVCHVAVWFRHYQHSALAQIPQGM